MKKLVFVLLASLQLIAAKAQSVPAAAALEGQNKTLQERYVFMKTKSETYQDFKVIKESIMDGVWKMAGDSLKKKEKEIEQANAQIKLLQTETDNVKAALKAKEDSMAGVVFASTHITVLGASFTKGFFLLLIVIGGAVLASSILLLMARIKAMQVFVKESKLIIESTASEFEDYKRKSFEKQTKLTRELQTERNKLMEYKESQKAV